ncbi:MAG TPA: TrkA C-terminal domain-containing protein, partial [Limnochorda sp.]
GYSRRELLLLAWAGLKGAVPIILATFPLVAGVEESDVIFHLVFFVVLTSALVQGSTISPLAKWLGLVEAVAKPKPVSLELVAVEQCDTDLIEVEITPGSDVQGKTLSELNLPPNVAISAIVRQKQVVTPRGNTRLEPGDVVFVLAGKHYRERVLDFFTGEDSTSATAPAT